MLVILIGLSIIALVAFTLSIIRRDWGQILAVVVSVILFLFGAGATIGMKTERFVIELQPGPEVRPQLEIGQIVPPADSDEFDFVIQAINTGQQTAEKCTALLENLTTGKQDHVWVSEMINPGDFGKVWLAKAVKDNGIWKTWLITPELADTLAKGYIITKITWAYPLPSGIHKLRLTVYAQTQSAPREFELSNPPDSRPTLTVVR